jgi:BioD-like phosphotransacetylase family protein
MSALATPTRVLVLTKGVEPIEYVTNEAGEEGTALVIVEQDTLATMDALETVIESARFDHPDKLARMAELFEDHGNSEHLASLAN